MGRSLGTCPPTTPVTSKGQQGDAQAYNFQDAEGRVSDPCLHELCTVLARAANTASNRPAALGTRTSNNFMSLAAKHLLLGRTLVEPLEPQADQDEQYLGASRHRQDILNLWWKPWRDQGFDDILAYDHLRKSKSHANLEAEPCAANQDVYTRPAEDDQGIETDVQQLEHLGSTAEVELLETSYNYDYELTGA